MGRLTRGNVWEDFEKLLIDLDGLLPSMDAAQYHPLTIALEREDGARFVIYRREVTDDHVHALFDYAEEHLEVKTTIRRAPRVQADDAPAGDADSQAIEEICGCKTDISLARQTTPSNWIDRLGPMIADALESGELPDKTQAALEDFVVNITDEHASGYADQARYLLGLGLRRIIANPPEDSADDDNDADDSDEAEAEPKAAPQNMLFNLCDYQYLKLDFLLSEGGDKAFSFSLNRDPSTRESDRGLADACFYTFGEKDSSFLYEGIYVPKYEGAIEHSVDIVITGEGKVQFCGQKDVLLFSLYWEKDENDLEGGFDIFDSAGLVQSLEFFK